MIEEHPILNAEEVTALNAMAHSINKEHQQWLCDGVCNICNKQLWNDKNQDFYSGITIRIHGRKHLEKLKVFL